MVPFFVFFCFFCFFPFDLLLYVFMIFTLNFFCLFFRYNFSVFFFACEMNILFSFLSSFIKVIEGVSFFVVGFRLFTTLETKPLNDYMASKRIEVFHKIFPSLSFFSFFPPKKLFFFDKFVT